MKVALVIDCFDPRRGGAEQWTSQFAARLVRDGHEVHVVTDHRAPEAAHPGLVLHRLPRGGSRLEFAADAERKLRALEPEVIHDMGVGWYCDVLQPHGGSRQASMRQNLLLLPGWLRPLKQGLMRVLPRYREFDALAARQYAGRPLVVALSRMVMADLQRFNRVPLERIRLVYNGVDSERFSPERRGEHREAIRRELGLGDELLLLTVAHNFRLKGVPTAVRATGILRAEGRRVHLAVVGGKHAERWAGLARRAGAAGAVTFLGAVADPVPYYAAADVYVQPTFYDPCSLVVLEALACGLPVITSRYNGAGELMREGLHGYLVRDPDDPEELAERLRGFFDQARRQPLGLAARQLALEHSLERNYREILAVYGEASAGRRRAA
ncbi:MAG: glycosyltransferase family 4 protein [Pirellulales bacterium]